MRTYSAARTLGGSTGADGPSVGIQFITIAALKWHARPKPAEQPLSLESAKIWFLIAELGFLNREFHFPTHGWLPSFDDGGHDVWREAGQPDEPRQSRAAPSGRLATHAGVIMEDASLLAITMPAGNDAAMVEALDRLTREAEAVSRLVDAAMALAHLAKPASGV